MRRATPVAAGAGDSACDSSIAGTLIAGSVGSIRRVSNTGAASGASMATGDRAGKSGSNNSTDGAARETLGAATGA